MTMHATASDAALISLVAAGDESAFRALYQRHQGLVYRFALMMSGRANIADDVTQEVFLFFLQRADRFDAGKGALASFLIGVARNCVRRRREVERVTSPLDESVPARNDPFADCARREEIDRVRAAILELPIHYREAVVLCELQEMSYADAAAALDCAVGTINSRLHRARAILTRKLRRVASATALTVMGCLR